MTKTIFTTLFLLTLLSNTFAQKHTYIGAEAAVNHDVYNFIDNGTLLKDGAIISGYFGLNIRQDLTAKTFVETGLLRKYYYEGIGFTPFPSYSSGNAINAWLIPLRLGTRLNISNHKVYLVPVIGFTLGINSDYGYGDGGIGGYEMNNKDTIYHATYSKLSLTRTFPLLQTGMGVEFTFLRTAIISFAANYFTGFKNVIEQDIQYTHNSVSNSGKGLSKGEMVSFGLAIKYPVSKLWGTNK